VKEEDIKALRDDLKVVGDQVRTHAEVVAKEQKRLGEMTGETRAAVDKVLSEQGALTQRLGAAEQLIVKLEQGGAGGRVKRLTAGEIAGSSEQLKALIAGGAQVGMSARINVNAAVTSDPASAGDLLVPQYDGIIPTPRRRLTIRDLLAQNRTSAASIVYMKETLFTNNAAPVAENTRKPESDITYEAMTANVVTIAHFIKLAKQILDDVPALQGEINNAMTWGLKYKEELQLLLGNGVGLNMNGIYTQAQAYVNPGVTVVAENVIDRLRLMILQASLAEYEADALVLNPINWAGIELSKDTTNAYLFGMPGNLLNPSLWNRPVVATQAMAVDTALVGAFQQGAMLYDREDLNVVIATQNEDDFVNNMITVRVEERLAMAVKRPQAFVKGSIAGL
jgi:HK97 family phage major capsid protein